MPEIAAQKQRTETPEVINVGKHDHGNTRGILEDEIRLTGRRAVWAQAVTDCEQAHETLTRATSMCAGERGGRISTAGGPLRFNLTDRVRTILMDHQGQCKDGVTNLYAECQEVHNGENFRTLGS